MTIPPEAGRSGPTLTHALLGWLLIPLFFLLTVSVYTTYRNASHLAQTERDLVLEEITDDLKESLAAELNTYFAIYDPSGKLLAGDPRLALTGAGRGQRTVFDDIMLGGRKLRRAILKGDPDDLPGFEIQVAETRVRRERLPLHLIRDVFVPQA